MNTKIKKIIEIIILFLIIITILFIYTRFINTKGLIIKEYNIDNSNLSDYFYGFKIIHFGDIHYKVTTDKKELKKIVNEINLKKPDIVIFSGDLFDNNIKYTLEDYNDLIEILRSINYNIGKYYINGENDINRNIDDIMSKSGFINLNDTYKIIYGKNSNILLLGISSNYFDNHIQDTINNFNIKEEYNYSILVLHEPDFIDYIYYNNYNLILAGHSHNGQIILPYLKNIIKQKYSTKYYDNYYELDDTKLYITSGIGTHKYKYRFLNKPSINLYRLRNK